MIFVLKLKLKLKTMKTSKLNPYCFFLKFAGSGYDPAKESKAAGRARCAKALAVAERKAKAAGVVFDWSRDDITNRSFTDEGTEYSLWQCVARREAGGVVLGSLGGVDFGEAGQPWGDSYARVVEAEIASEIDYDALTEEKVADHFPACAAEVGIDWGVDGCFVVNARNGGGQEIFSGTFPGRGGKAMDDAVTLARLMAEACGAKVVGPEGLVEAVEHPGGVDGVLGLSVPGAVPGPALRPEVLPGVPLAPVSLFPAADRIIAALSLWVEEGNFPRLGTLMPNSETETFGGAIKAYNASAQAAEGPRSSSSGEGGHVFPSLVIHSASGEVVAVDLARNDSELAALTNGPFVGVSIVPVCLALAAPEFKALADCIRGENSEPGTIYEMACGILAKLQKRVMPAPESLWADRERIPQDAPTSDGWCDECGDTAAILHAGAWRCGSCGVLVTPTPTEKLKGGSVA